MTDVCLIESRETVTTRNSLWRNSPATKPRLRVAVVADGLQIARCYAAVLEDLLHSNFVDLALVLTGGPSPASNGHNKRWSHALYNFYLRVEDRKHRPDDPLEKIDCSDLLANVERLDLGPLNGPPGSDAPAISETQSSDLDVLVHLGGRPLPPELHAAARYGAWSYCHRDPEAYPSGPPGFWELYERTPVIGAALEACLDLDQPIVLCKSWFATQQTTSVASNRFAPYWGASEMIVRKLNELHQFGWDHLVKNSVQLAAGKGKQKVRTTPSNLEMTRWLAPAVLKKATRPLRVRSVQHWKIGIRANADTLLDPNATLDDFRWIDAPEGHFWADPLGFEHQGKNWVFFEDYSYAEKRAAIACAELSRDGNLLAPVRCLDNPARHYSYPLLFRDGQEIFMVPESYDSEVVDLYHCQTFPDKWTREATLLRGKFVDTTIWRDQGLWWIMTTTADPNPRTACLFLFYAESLTGEWHFHPANPISTDVRNNRGAGRIFRFGANWIRPSQSCAPIYGYSFTLNEITALSTEHYAERPLRTITPESWGLCAVHTYNRVGNFELIDGASMVPRNRVEKVRR